MYMTASNAMIQLNKLQKSYEIVTGEIKKAVSSNDALRIQYLSDVIKNINEERKRQNHRIYQDRIYSARRLELNKQMLEVGMTVYFYDKVRKMGIIKKKCNKTLVINEVGGNTQWQISYARVKPVRRKIHLGV